VTSPQTPNFLVVGAGRCGTTALVEGLRSHPQVFVTEPKEPHYFALHGTVPAFAGPGDAHTINRVAVTDRQAYLALYPQQDGHTARGDGSVSTLYYHERALPEVLAMNPRMRLIVLLRDPVARAYSSHQYMRARGFEPHESFLDAVGEEEHRRAQNWHHLWHYTQMSRYAEAIEHLQREMPADQLGVWFYEDLDRDYVGTMSEVLRFLGLPPGSEDDTGVPRVNISGRPRFDSLHRALWWATRHEALRTAVKRTTTYRFRERVRRLALRRDEIPGEAREALSPVFEQDLVRLRTLLPGPGPAWLTSQIGTP
jgi:hypothetical protein